MKVQIKRQWMTSLTGARDAWGTDYFFLAASSSSFWKPTIAFERTGKKTNVDCI
jgi:hypothetical protein